MDSKFPKDCHKQQISLAVQCHTIYKQNLDLNNPMTIIIQYRKLAKISF